VGTGLEGGAMKFYDIQKMAKGLGIYTFRMKKPDMIRAIQLAENNIDCYGTARVEICVEETCLWRKDCLSLNKIKGVA
jgi:hypothetical protein